MLGNRKTVLGDEKLEDIANGLRSGGLQNASAQMSLAA